MVYGFIGLGNMAKAILGGMRKSPVFAGVEILGAEPDEVRATEAADTYAVRLAQAAEVMASADTVLLAVKPQVLSDLLPTLAPRVREGQLIVSIAAGREIAFYEGILPEGTSFVRVMPNINAMVGAAAAAVCGGTYATPAQVGEVRAVFGTVGATFEIPEKLFSAFTALSGSSPAFVYRYIETIARAGEAAGFSYETALRISCAVALGSAKMAGESGIAPEALVKMVCSPGGTTVEGVKVLDSEDFSGTVTRAFEAVVKRDRELRS